LKANDQLLEIEFIYDELNENQYRDIRFNKLVFCEGYGAHANPFFKHLPFQWNKGEILTVNIPELSLKEILKKKVFVLPLKEKAYKVGATYEREWLNLHPSEKKKKLLETLLKEIVVADFELLKHESGIRPAVKDRRPLLGRDENSGYYLLNGLGSRGCLMGPLLSYELVAFIEDEQALSEEVNVNRFC
jgi:glycine/D-amino acid oxidase-like deaminating enzyme